MPVRVDLRQLPQRPGAQYSTTIPVNWDEPLGTPVMAVPAHQTMDVDITVSVIDQGVLARAHGDFVAEGECVRCLEPVKQPLVVDIAQVFYLSQERDKLCQLGDEDAAEAPIIVDDAIDLEPLLVDAIVTQLPYQPLCTDDCRGLCAECGVPLAQALQDHHHEQRDARWSALEDFFKEA